MRSLFLLTLISTFSPLTSTATPHFISPNGSDTNPGTISQPFATLQHANTLVAPGDTVFIRGGTYRIPADQIAHRKGIFARIIHLDRSGAPDRRINYHAYRNERPIFDFSAVKPTGHRVHAISVPASWIHLKGLEVIGVQVTMKGHTQSICFENNGSHNIFENLSMHDGQAIGIYSVRGSDNLFLNCDAWNNHDPVSGDRRGGNVDGFGCHPRKGDTGNVFRGCRAWFNSDDGFDCINAAEPVTFENCWAFYNGYSTDFKPLADGNGFKAGGYGSTPAARLPSPIPRHLIRNCLAVRNRANGFYANHHPGGCDWTGNTAHRNSANFNMLGRLPDNTTDIPGHSHLLRNNQSHHSRNHLTHIDRPRCTLTNNNFDTNSPPPIDESNLTHPRQPDGTLPALKVSRPKERQLP